MSALPSPNYYGNIAISPNKDLLALNKVRTFTYQRTEDSSIKNGGHNRRL